MSDPNADERHALIVAVTETATHLAPTVRRSIVDRARGLGNAAAIPSLLVPLSTASPRTRH